MSNSPNSLPTEELLMLVRKVVADNPQLTLQRIDANTGEIVFVATKAPLTSEEWTPIELDHLNNNRTIAAIKCLRERLGLGLGDAKRRVDAYRNMSNIPF